jgi:hypothetical protein
MQLAPQECIIKAMLTPVELNELLGAAWKIDVQGYGGRPLSLT